MNTGQTTTTGQVSKRCGWPRYSLRTALGFFAIIAVVLAFWAVPLIRQRWAVEGIRRVGGDVHFDAPSSGLDESDLRRHAHHRSAPDWLRTVIGEGMRTVNIQNKDLTGTDALERVSRLSDLESLSLSHSVFDERELAHLKACHSLRFLFLQYTPVGDTGIEFLRRAHKLEMLNLAYTKVSDSGVRNIARCSILKYLCLWGTNVGDASIPIISKLNKLTELEIGETKFSDEGINQLRTALPGCKITH